MFSEHGFHESQRSTCRRSFKSFVPESLLNLSRVPLLPSAYCTDQVIFWKRRPTVPAGRQIAGADLCR